MSDASSSASPSLTTEPTGSLANEGSFAGCTEQPGDVIGPYKLIQVLGEGGFGVVWLAERSTPMVQRVALKIIKPGMDSRSVIARFEQERQALAVMDHPNVAKVLDGGMTLTGRPYFVMELVKGESVTLFCDRNRLTTRQRLELFISICEAVQHAHLKGIIHRDIKPSNILVSPIGDERSNTAAETQGMLVKVIDFGVAKAMSRTLTDKTIFTEQGQIIGTPEYMSPEQAEMGATDVDTRTDIYSLGVVLYETLSGLLPFDAKTLRAASHAEIQRIIRESDPPRPSTRISAIDDATAAVIARARQTDRNGIAGELRRELEWIPLKAMRKDRRERYTTAHDLADDVRRYLSGEPLSAGPESQWYRLRKFALRRANLSDIVCVIIGFVLFSAFPFIMAWISNMDRWVFHPAMYTLLLPGALTATGIFGLVTRELFQINLSLTRRFCSAFFVMLSGGFISTFAALVWPGNIESAPLNLLGHFVVFCAIHVPMLSWLNGVSMKKMSLMYLITSLLTFGLGYYSASGGALALAFILK